MAGTSTTESKPIALLATIDTKAKRSFFGKKKSDAGALSAEAPTASAPAEAPPKTFESSFFGFFNFKTTPQPATAEAPATTSEPVVAPKKPFALFGKKPAPPAEPPAEPASAPVEGAAAGVAPDGGKKPLRFSLKPASKAAKGPAEAPAPEAAAAAEPGLGFFDGVMQVSSSVAEGFMSIFTPRAAAAPPSDPPATADDEIEAEAQKQAKCMPTSSSASKPQATTSSAA